MDQANNLARPSFAVLDKDMELNPNDGMTVVLEDHGQDFLEFDIKEGHIVATRPFQGFVWDGAVVFNETLVPGDYMCVRTRFSSVSRMFRYPIVEVRQIASMKGGA